MPDASVRACFTCPDLTKCFADPTTLTSSSRPTPRTRPSGAGLPGAYIGQVVLAIARTFVGTTALCGDSCKGVRLFPHAPRSYALIRSARCCSATDPPSSVCSPPPESMTAVRLIPWARVAQGLAHQPRGEPVGSPDW